MHAIRHGRSVAVALLLTTTLFVYLSAAALVAAAPANAGPPAGPSASAQALDALLAVQQAQLTASDGAAYDEFGCSVALSGDTAVVGAYVDTVGANANQGSAYVFVRSGTTWSQQAKLTALDGAANDYFGGSVAVSGDTAVVGAYGDDVGANADQGSAYIFVRSGTTWSQQAKLTAADGAASDQFGWSVALSGDAAVVGARYDTVGANPSQGSAYIFVRSGTTWSQQAKLTAADGAVNDLFGCSVTISGDTAVVGARNDKVGANAYQGSAYVFVRSGTTWSQQAQLTAADGAANDDFGTSIALSGDTAVAGADCDTVGANAYQGSAYVFVRSTTTWSQQAKLTAADGAANDYFGQSVAVSGGTAAVGAFGDDVGASTEQGSAYAYARNGTVWSQQQKLTASDGAASDRFGYSVALSGDTAVVGADGHDVGGIFDQGAAYVFTGVDTAPPGDPTNVVISADGACGATITWTNPTDSDFDHVRIVRKLGSAPSGPTDGSVRYEGSGASFHDTGLADGVTYFYGLYAYDHVGNASSGVQGQVVGEDLVPPAAVTGLIASGGVSSCSLSWVNPGDSDFDHVKVVRKSGSDPSGPTDGALVYQGWGVSATDSPLAAGTYHYGVWAYDGAGNASAGAFATAAVSAPAVPGRPLAKSPKGLISSRTPTFRWTAATGAATYEVRIYRGSRVIRKKTGITKLSWKCTRRLPRKVWLTWKVRAHNAGGWGSWSAKPRFKVR